MTECPVDFSQLKPESHDAIEFLGQLAMMGDDKHNHIPLPRKISLHADRPEAPIAVFYVEMERPPDDLHMVLLHYDEAEMFREGRGTRLHVQVRPANRKVDA